MPVRWWHSGTLLPWNSRTGPLRGYSASLHRSGRFRRLSFNAGTPIGTSASIALSPSEVGGEETSFGEAGPRVRRRTISVVNEGERFEGDGISPDLSVVSGSVPGHRDKTGL